MGAKQLVTETSFFGKKPDVLRRYIYEEKRRKGLRWKKGRGVHFSGGLRA
jgi:hypothetical protein